MRYRHSRPPLFRQLLTKALKEFAERGFTSSAALQSWLMRLHRALDLELPTDDATRREVLATLQKVFARETLKGGVQKRVPGVDRYTIDRVAPQLRAELDRRIFASADLIRLNKQAAVEKTLQRFSGWATSLPPTERPIGAVREAAAEILKPTAQLKFQRRRVAIDQAHKLSANVAHVVAQGAGAIACIWHDRGQYDHNYDARPEHLKRSGKLFLLKNSWAMDQGLIRRGAAPYYEDLEDQVSVLPYCSCWAEFSTSPRALPEDLLTAAGRAWLKA